MNTLLRTALCNAPRPRLVSAACTCTRAASSSSSSSSSATSSKYTLPNGLQLKGTVIAAGRMAQTEYSRHTKFLVHDPDSACVVGDQVLIRNCRPVSARKRFELVQVTKGARERVESHHAPQGGAGAPPPASTA
ncbi:hypothetical protein RHOSPDRAFT_35126 [Rhodotorula sp. JG-1b]|nr:hypothetical protein RHOSPDRAFT_35126 [Rhodotorula sp. JG-1b]